MNLRLAQNDAGDFFTLHTMYTGTFTVDIDVYSIDGIKVDGTFWTIGNITFQQMMDKYHYVPKEIMEGLFIDVTMDSEGNQPWPKVWSGL